MRSLILFTASLLTSALSKTIVITVGGNTTSNAGAVFKPQSVVAAQGDVVYFNFTQGNHTAIQSDFASPCIPISQSNVTINGFNSGFRDAGNFTSVTPLMVPIDNPNKTIWFFDWNTCAKGGVGGVNVNGSGWETLDGFTRNALRLNGTSGSSTKPSSSHSATSTGAQASQTPSKAHVERASGVLVLGMSLVVPMLLGIGAVSV
ncbi:hypothetical protein CPB83DRAFT_247164 [Crepidotus variabilis]|uniref:Uncharacterized protein n=1 Tax=Crepidotus variabilis TaxID=179855 RepID=A0A9P6EIW6_9AGAR|nr:hypothetical protein CPB83DRAFT_247164 [Crepidotus variabilis]